MHSAVAAALCAVREIAFKPTLTSPPGRGYNTGPRKPCCSENPNFPRNGLSDFAQYISERPEMIRKVSESKTAKQINKRKIKKMQKLCITFGTILLVLGCFWLSPAVKAVEGAPGIVGLWLEHYTGLGPAYDTYAQWHSDGLEIESPSFSLGQCQGTFKQVGARAYQLFHVGWLPGGGPGGSVRFELRELNTVSVDKNSFDGTYDQKFFDADGNVVFEDMGTLHGTRLSVDQFADQPNATAGK